MHPETHESPKQVHLNFIRANSRGSISPRKKEIYSFRDDSNCMNGPYDINILKLWLDNDLISPDTLIYDNTSQESICLSDLIASKKPTDFQQKDINDWFLWVENPTPYRSLYNRLSRYLTLKHHQNEPIKLSIVTPIYPIASPFQEYEEFLNSYKSAPPDIVELQLNELAQPFAAWVQKILTSFNCHLTLDELKNLLLIKEPSNVKAFFEKKISSLNEDQYKRFYNSYIQWRMYIPIYVVST